MDLELLKARSLCKLTPRRAMCLLKEYYHEKGNRQTENEEGQEPRTSDRGWNWTEMWNEFSGLTTKPVDESR